MLKKLVKFALPIAVIVVIGYLVFAFFTGSFPFGTGLGDGDGEAIESEYATAQEEPEIEEPDIIEEPPSLIIEISEDRIIYEGEEISIEDLEKILRRYAYIQDIWEIHDVYRADRATYERVRELFRTHDVVYRLR